MTSKLLLGPKVQSNILRKFLIDQVYHSIAYANNQRHHRPCTDRNQQLTISNGCRRLNQLRSYGDMCSTWSRGGQGRSLPVPTPRSTLAAKHGSELR
jgi:hypothetical protein